MVTARNFIGALTFGVAAASLMAAAPTVAKAAGDTIVLGSAISFTGKYSANGIHTKNGYNLAVDMINKKGGVKIGGKTYKLAVKYYDDESTPARTSQLLERLIKQDGVKFMLGPYSSDTTKAAAPITEKYKIPMVEAEGASRSLFAQGYRYMFAVLATSEQYLASTISLAAEIAQQHGKKPSDVKVAMAYQNDAFSLDVRAGVVDDIKHYKMKVVIDDKMPRDLNDISATLTKVKALKPDVLLLSGHEKGAATAARQIGDMKIDTPIIAITHCEAAKITTNFPKTVEGVLCPTQWAETMTSRDNVLGSAGDYDKLFKATYEGYKNVPYQAAQASAAVLVWADALGRANSLDTEKVRDALAATDMMTFYGPVKFAPNGTNAGKKMALRQIQGGHYNVIAPANVASHKIIWPRKAN